MLNAPELIELRRANPVSLDEARRLAAELSVHSRLEAMPLTPRPAPRAHRRALVSVLVAAALIAAIVSATPARAWIRNVLPFWDQPAAPASVQVQFWSLNVGAPPGMSPQAVAGETREVGRFTFGGSARTLWVAPAKNGGFCSLWLPGMAEAAAPQVSRSARERCYATALRCGSPATSWLQRSATS